MNTLNTQDNEDTLEKHLERANMLIEHKHQEPFSHQAVAMDSEEIELFTKTFVTTKTSEQLDNSHLWIKKPNRKNVFKQKGVCYNLRGFISQRYVLENL